MPMTIGDNYYISAGETLLISKTAKREDGSSIADIKAATLAIEQGITVLQRECVVVGTNVSYVLESEDTIGMFGDYRYIVMVEEYDGTMTRIALGKIEVQTSPMYGASGGLVI